MRIFIGYEVYKKGGINSKKECKNVLDEISNIGYINFNDYFNTNYKHSCNEETLLLHIKTTTMIADLEMDDLNDILNGKECMSMLEHNYEQFQKQDQFFKLVDDLKEFFS